MEALGPYQLITRTAARKTPLAQRIAALEKERDAAIADNAALMTGIHKELRRWVRAVGARQYLQLV